MADTTGISWTDATWNPVTGCHKVSPGCKHCYAEREWKRLSANPKTVYFGRAFTDVGMHPERLEAPFHWTKPRRIFVNSMSDLFHAAVPFEFIDKVFAVMSVTTRHQYQILTKRPDRMLEYFESRCHEDAVDIFGFPEATDSLEVWPQWTPAKARRGGYDNCGPAWPLENVCLGVSCEDQERAAERIPLLLRCPAAVRFVSAEPLLGPMDLRCYIPSTADVPWHGIPGWNEGPFVNWVIAGGESGPRARPTHPQWFRNLRDQCAAAGVPFHFKQWGEYVSVSEVAGAGAHHQFEDGATVRRVGTKNAGRTLDGREHQEFPA